MTVLTLTSPTARARLTPLILTNGLTVSTLYWTQSLTLQASADLGQGWAVRLMPGASLAGYAVGVALLAFVMRDLTSARGLSLHATLLAVSLCLLAIAPTSSFALAACLFIGIGCSLTQRVLASAAAGAPQGRRANVIGIIIAAGLFGILLARALVPVASATLGWRALFAAAALALMGLGLLAAQNSGHAACLATEDGAVLPSALVLWREQTTLRRAALQQALVFALYNMGWVMFPRLLAALAVPSSVPMGVVAGVGAIAAMLAGRACGSRGAASVASFGLCAITLAVCLGVIALWLPPAYLIGMVLLDMGTQIALVANQARAQALAVSPAMRGRLAAMVTTVGFAGGALGAVIGNLIL